MYVCLAWSLQLVYRTGRRWIEIVEGHGQTGGITTSAAIMWGGWGTADWGSLKQSLQSGQTILDLGWLMLTHKKAISVSDPLNRWKDNSPRADLMQCWGRLRTLTEGDQAERIWVGNFKTRSCFWVRERICITHSLFDGLSHVSLGSPFCGCVWIKYLLCLIFFFWESKSYVWSCFAAMLANMRSVSLMQQVGAHGVPLTPQLPGNQVSAVGLALPWRFKPNW